MAIHRKNADYRCGLISMKTGEHLCHELQSQNFSRLFAYGCILILEFVLKFQAFQSAISGFT